MGNSQSQISTESTNTTHRSQEIDRISKENEQNWGGSESVACRGSHQVRDVLNIAQPENKAYVSNSTPLPAGFGGGVQCNILVDIVPSQKPVDNGAISKSNSSESIANRPKGP